MTFDDIGASSEKVEKLRSGLRRTVGFGAFHRHRVDGLKAFDAFGIDDEPLHGAGGFTARVHPLRKINVVNLFAEG